MAEPRMIELAQELLQRSRDRKVPWEEKTTRGRVSSQAAYQVVFPDGTLILTRTRGVRRRSLAEKLEQYTEYRLDLLSDTGSIIDSLTSEPNEAIYQALTEILDLAQSYVRERGISKALDFLKSR